MFAQWCQVGLAQFRRRCQDLGTEPAGSCHHPPKGCPGHPCDVCNLYDDLALRGCSTSRVPLVPPDGARDGWNRGDFRDKVAFSSSPSLARLEAGPWWAKPGLRFFVKVNKAVGPETRPQAPSSGPAGAAVHSPRELVRRLSALGSSFAPFPDLSSTHKKLCRRFPLFWKSI